MRRIVSPLVALVLAAMPATISPARAQPGGKTLDIYFIDTEGGQATLYVAPSGQTLLVDTGNAGERDLGRILEVLDLAGVKQIDHLFLTHYHGDHYGSMPELSKRIPIKHFYDHGESVEKERPNVAAFLKAYPEIVANGARTAVKPGDKIALAGTDVTVVTSDGNVLQTPIAKAPGAGRPNPACAGFKERDETKVDPDNHQSAGFVMAYGTVPDDRPGRFHLEPRVQVDVPEQSDRHGRSVPDQSPRPRPVGLLGVGARDPAARGDHEQRHAQRRRRPDVPDSRVLARARGSVAAALVVLGRHRAQRARRDDCERRRAGPACGDRHRSSARWPDDGGCPAGGPGRQRESCPGALSQGDCADRRVVPDHEQP